MAPARTFKKTDPGTAKVCNRAVQVNMALVIRQKTLWMNLFEKVGGWEEQDNILRMQLMINSQNSSKASNVLKAWGEIQEASLKPIIKPNSITLVSIPLLEHFWQLGREKRGSVQQQQGPGPVLPKPFSQYVLPDSRDCKGGTMEYQRSDFCFWRFASVRFRLTVVSCVLPRQRRNAAKSLDFWSSCSWLWISVSSRHSYLFYGGIEYISRHTGNQSQ